ncbi:MAG: hypothetical protein HOC23_03000 [Halieaceae bacterium]|nr:hypothetical protein [Halieaceae bacterium]
MTYSRAKSAADRLMNDRLFVGKRYFDLFMMVLIILSVVMLLAEMDGSQIQLPLGLYAVEDLLLSIFVIEYLMRFWVCSDVGRDYKTALQGHHHHPIVIVVAGIYAVIRGKIRWMILPMSIIDLLAILPMFRVFRAFRIFRLLRLFKLVRYSHSMESLFLIFKENAAELLVALAFVGLIVVISSTFIFMLESGAPSTQIHTLGDALWWSFVTITTVGYGDTIPTTGLGRALGVLLMLGAIVAIALPSGVLASAMTQKFISMREGKLTMKKFRNHVVICGWNNSAEQLMTELLVHHHMKSKWDIVAVTLKPASEIDNQTVLLKHGDFTKESVLLDVNIADASCIIVVAEELRGISDESIDARSFLACNLIKNINPQSHIIAQLLNRENAKLLEQTMDSVEIVISDDITGGLLSNSIINPGTSKLVNTLIIQNKDNITKIPISKLRGDFSTYAEVFAYCRLPKNNWLPMALERDGELEINPKDDFAVTAGDNLFYIRTESES